MEMRVVKRWPKIGCWVVEFSDEATTISVELDEPARADFADNLREVAETLDPTMEATDEADS